MSMEEYLPIKVETYRGTAEDATFDSVVLAEIVDEDEDEMGHIQVAFDIKGFRHFLTFRKFDLRNALAPSTSGAKHE